MTFSSASPFISLHGFYGDKTFKDRVRELLPQHGESSPLPDSWKREILIENYDRPHRPLFIDRRFAEGHDDNHPYGLEASTLAFYAGHGDTNSWSVPDSRSMVPLSKVLIGDEALRYFWLYSCHVMAHGPRINDDYPAPQCFVPFKNHANVFENERWGNALGPHARMACGGSTFLGYTHVGEIWNYLLERQTSIADAFILGLAHIKQIPVCLARGGQDRATSALADRTLLSEEIAHGDWMHLQYPVNCTARLDGSKYRVSCSRPSVPAESGKATVCGASTEPPLPPELDEHTPGSLPKVKTLSLPAPGLTAARLPLGFVQLEGHDTWKYQPDSGGFVLGKSREVPDRYNALTSCDQETEWTVQPVEFLAKLGLDAQILTSDLLTDFSPTALEMRVESRTNGATSGPCGVRSLFLLFHSSINVGTESSPKRYPVFGPAVVFEFQRQSGKNLELASFSAPRRTRTVKSLDTPTLLKTASTAIKEAHGELQLKAEDYPIANARAVLGYEEAPLRCRQEFLRPTYEIRFFPTDAARPDSPTVTVRKDARLNPSDEGWTCRGWGDFPPP